MGTKKRVVIAQNASLVDHFGLTTYLKNIINTLAFHREFDMYIFPLKGSSSYTVDSLTITPLSGDVYSIKGNMVYCFGLYKQLKKLSDIDVIHCLYPVSSLLAAVLYKVFHDKSVRIVYDVRSPWVEMGMEKELLPTFLQRGIRFLCYRIESFLSRYVDQCIFITEGLHHHYEQMTHHRFHPVSIIPSGVDTKFFQNKGKEFLRKQLGLSSSDIVIGYAGTIQQTREMDFLIKVVKRITASDTRYKLVFVGDGDDKAHLEQVTKELGLESHVFFTGQVPYEQMPWYISGFDVGVCHLPDRFVFRYSSPLKVLEYISCGIPVLCSDIVAHRDIAQWLPNIEIYTDDSSFIKKLKSIRFTPSSDIETYDWQCIVDEISKTW